MNSINMVTEELIITIPDAPPFYSLYSDGIHSHKRYIKDEGVTLLYYPPQSVIALYYTYPSFRKAALVRFTGSGGENFPGLSQPVKTIFELRASKTDKLRRAIAHLQKHSGGAFVFTGDFYLRLYFILQTRGKLDYSLLETLAGKYRLKNK